MEAQFALLKGFVDMCKVQPDLLHHPKLQFYRDFIESLGGKIPPKQEESTEPKAADEPMPNAEPEVEEEVIPKPELDESGVIQPDVGEPLPMGDTSKQPSEGDLEAAGEERSKAMAAFSDGNNEDALKHYTAAIQLNPGAAALHAKRAQVLLAMSRPVAAINDCDEAIKLNPDSAIAYKFRGMAERLVGNWVKAHADLATACRLDYDDDANRCMKEVEENARKMRDYERAVERQREEKELWKRKERVRKAHEANAKAKSESQSMPPNMDEDMGSDFLGDMLGGALKDPELQAAMKDPEVMKAVLEVMQNPASLVKHMSNPKVMQVVAKLQGAFGGGAGMAGGCPAGSGPCPDSGCADGAKSKAPEPDLD